MTEICPTLKTIKSHFKNHKFSAFNIKYVRRHFSEPNMMDIRIMQLNTTRHYLWSEIRLPSFLNSIR